jgi:DNA-binding protein H-NS
MSIETEYEKLIRERDEHASRMQEVEKKLKEIREQQADTVLSEIKNKVHEYGFTPAQIFGNALGVANSLRATRGPNKEKKGTPVKVIKYKNEEGLTWSGGRGPKPKWVAEILAAGGDIEKYRIPEDAPPHIVLNV